MRALVIDPPDPSTLLAGTDGYFGDGAGVFRTTDGGGTWSEVLTLPYQYTVQGLSLDQADPADIFAADFGLHIGQGDVYTSADGGTTWSAMGNDFSQPHMFAVAADPSAPGLAYSGSRYYTENGNAYVTADGGADWALDDSGSMARHPCSP